MAIHALAGKKALPKSFVTRKAMSDHYFRKYSPKELLPVKNGTSGHRGKAGRAFSEQHIKAIAQALVDIRSKNGTWGPKGVWPKLDVSLATVEPGAVISGKDVRDLSDFAQITAAEVFAGNGMKVVINKGDRSTPTPIISFTIISRNYNTENVEGIIHTASHNPNDQGGIKSNGRDGGPNTETKAIDELANKYLNDPSGILSMPLEKAMNMRLVVEKDLITPYLEELKDVVDMDIIKKAGPIFAVTSLGGSSHGIYKMINNMYGTKIKVINDVADPSGSMRTYDWDGELRGDPSSKYVMRAVEGELNALKVKAIFANDNDADRFGIEDSTGIINPNHALCVLFDYLCQNRQFSLGMGIGRTIGTTHMLDLIAESYGRPHYEVNVGFKYYVDGLINKKYVLAGEESAGLSLPRMNGNVWVTEKDGIAANLLMMEIMARTGKNMGELYQELVAKFGKHNYERIDSPATPESNAKVAAWIKDKEGLEKVLNGKIIAGRKIERIKAGDGIKVVLEGGVWVLFRASGTEPIMKVYMEERGKDLSTAKKAAEELKTLLNL